MDSCEMRMFVFVCAFVCVCVREFSFHSVKW